MSTRAMPPCWSVLLETSLLGYRSAAPATTGRLAATKMYTDVQSCLRRCSGTGMKVPWYVNMATNTCLATCALPRRLSLKTCPSHSGMADACLAPCVVDPAPLAGRGP